MIKQHGSYLFVEIEDGAKCEISKRGGVLTATTYGIAKHEYSFTLPEGQWQILSMLDEVGEEQAMEIVSANQNIYNTWYRDYCYKMGTKKPDTVFQFDTALESLRSLSSSLGLKGRIVILKQIK